MTMKNKHVLRSKISETKFRQLVRLFCLDLATTQIARVTSLNRNIVNCFREYVNEFPLLLKLNRLFLAKLRLMKTIFGARRVRELRGRGSRGKTIVFGLFKRQGRVHTGIVPDCSRSTLQGIIRGRVDPGKRNSF